MKKNNVQKIQEEAIACIRRCMDETAFSMGLLLELRRQACLKKNNDQKTQEEAIECVRRCMDEATFSMGYLLELRRQTNAKDTPNERPRRSENLPKLILLKGGRN